MPPWDTSREAGKRFCKRRIASEQPEGQHSSLEPPAPPAHSHGALCGDPTRPHPQSPLAPAEVQPRGHGHLETLGTGRAPPALASPSGAAAASGRGRRGNPPALQNKHTVNPHHLKAFRNWDFICCSHGCITVPSSAPSPSHRSDTHRAPKRGFLGVISKVTDADGGFCSAALSPSEDDSSCSSNTATVPQHRAARVGAGGHCLDPTAPWNNPGGTTGPARATACCVRHLLALLPPQSWLLLALPPPEATHSPRPDRAAEEQSLPEATRRTKRAP